MISQKILFPLFLLFLSSRCFFLFLSFLAQFFIPLRLGYLGDLLNPNASSLFWVWANFDGYHYLQIATLGYEKLIDSQKFAFFPLYPLLISTINQVFKVPPLFSGIFISAISFFLSLIVIYKITKLDYDHKTSLITLILLSFFPLSFFYHSVYPDSLFLLLSTSSFYFARKGGWYVAGIFAGLTTFDRLSGLSLLPALSMEFYIQNKDHFSRKINFLFFSLKQFTLPLLLAALGFIVYILYLQLNFGDWMLFQKSMADWKQDKFIFPPQVIFRYLKIFFSVSPSVVEYWVAVLEFVSFFLYIFLSIYTWIKVRSSYGIFMIILLLLVPFTGTFAGNPRYILHLFPAFISLALLASKNNAFKITLILLFLILGFALTAFFTRGYFIS